MAENSSVRRAVAAETLRRKRCRESIASFALNIDIPTAPTGAWFPDETLLGPAPHFLATHHAKILETVQRTVTRPYGRALIMAPPGSAKSTYVTVVTPPWYMGAFPGSRIIATSYASQLIYRQSRRAKQIANSQLYRDIFDDRQMIIVKDSDPEWTLTNGSELLSAGLTAGITGNRANGAIIDDPVAGREEADSPAMRRKTMDAYQDDLMTRLLPGAWIILIMTRWNEQDLAGEILPHDYKGASGMIRCRDGMDWEVLNIPAKAEHTDDPLGRKSGEYLWTEYYQPRHWQMFENGQGPTRQRTWASLYQQRPTPQGSGRFTREMFHFYEGSELPTTLSKVICSDFAVSEGKNDFTEHGVWGLDHEDNLWALDWWYEQCNTGRGVQQMLEMCARHNIHLGFHEGGVIDKAIEALVVAQIRDWNQTADKKQRPRIFIDRRPLPSIADKLAKLAAFQGRAALGKVHFPRSAPWTERVIDQLLAIPAGRFDDAADVCGLAGRGLDQYHPPANPVIVRKQGIKPYTAAWIEYEEPKEPKVRYR